MLEELFRLMSLGQRTKKREDVKENCPRTDTQNKNSREDIRTNKKASVKANYQEDLLLCFHKVEIPDEVVEYAEECSHQDPIGMAADRTLETYYF